MVDKFNAASNGAIRLTTEGFEGDFLQESFFAAIHSAQRRVNRYGANGVAASTDLTQLKHNSVKIAGGFGPIRFEPSQMTWLHKPTAEGIEVASRNFAEAMLADQLNTAILALVYWPARAHLQSKRARHIRRSHRKPVTATRSGTKNWPCSLPLVKRRAWRCSKPHNSFSFHHKPASAGFFISTT
ncbi:major capsid protein [Janthinobacterium sp. FT14W]|uniref:major capsid protein n=1 Tax=Janthinobacterium sp. FT14W TaxID=2654253 RepID=UPI00221F1349|nr:major capsid protein [Janthinobacterium sp. FT14W]